LEARSEGLPVVTFDRGALGELVTHGETGYICATDDLAGLREGIRYFLDRPAERGRASANSLAAAARPDNDCTPAEFERKWWALVERASWSDAEAARWMDLERRGRRRGADRRRHGGRAARRPVSAARALDPGRHRCRRPRTSGASRGDRRPDSGRRRRRTVHSVDGG